LWAHHVVDTLMKNIHGRPTANGGEISDTRERVLKELVAWYANNRDPALFKSRLRQVVSGNSGEVEALLARPVSIQIWALRYCQSGSDRL
jgi:hypothetical protein